MAEQFSQVLQENLLTLLCYDPDSAALIRGAVPPDYFEGLYGEVARRAYSYIDTYGAPPGEHIADELEPLLTGDDRRRARAVEDILHGMYEVRAELNPRYVIGRLENFMRQQRMRGAIVEAADLLETGTDDALDQASLIIQEATKEGLKLFDPGLRLVTGDRSLDFLNLDGEVFPTGIPAFDRRAVGPMRGGLYLFVALPKRGKCIAGGERVPLPDGRWLPVREVVAARAPDTYSLDETAGTVTRGGILEHWDNGVKKCRRVRTRTGREVLVTPEHPFLTAAGWRNVGEIVPGDYIAVPRYGGGFGRTRAAEAQVKVTAYLIADGSLTKHLVGFTNHDPDTRNDFDAAVRACGSGVTWTSDVDAYVVNPDGARGRHNANPVRDLLKRSGLLYKGSADKFIPEWVFQLPRPQLALFLRTLFTCDGSIYDGGKTVEYSSASKRLVDEVYHLLTRFGIHGIKRTRGPRDHRITMRAADTVVLFLREVGFAYGKARRYGPPAARVRKSYVDVLPPPLCAALLRDVEREAALRAASMCKRLGTAYYKLRAAAGGAGCLSRNMADGIISELGLSRTSMYAWSDVLWDKVVENSDGGVHPTYDLTMQDHHNFQANDIIVHNTWHMVNLGKRAMMARYKVLHVTLEMSERKMAQRYYQALFGIAKRKEEMWVNKFDLNKLGQLVGLEPHKLTPRLAFNDPGVRKALQERQTRHGMLLGRLLIKQFPSGSLTVRELSAYLDNLESVEGWKPDLLIVDYPDLMRIDPRYVRQDLNRIYVDLRGLCTERNVAGAIASQSNRDGMNSKQVTEGNIAEDFSKIATVDCAVTYSQTEQERRLGLARLFVAVARDDEDKFTVLISQNYATGQFVRQSARLPARYNALLEEADADYADEEEDDEDE